MDTPFPSHPGIICLPPLPLPFSQTMTTITEPTYRPPTIFYLTVFRLPACVGNVFRRVGIKKYLLHAYKKKNIYQGSIIIRLTI